MSFANPLTDEELDELDGFLMSEATGEDAMDISMLDGFLTALAIAPENLPPSQWLPVVWGGSMAWQSQAQADRMTTLVLRHANDILLYLRDEPDTFEPLLYEREHEGRTTAIIDEWCTGFVRGMALDEEGWRPLMEAEEGEDMLYPILLYGTEVGWAELEANPEIAARHDEYVASLGECVLAMLAWWLPVRKAKSTIRRDDPKVGRNDLCPCGSGKKFKKCCGGQKILH
ncbi:MAG: UPF0149 family protein [Gammaproteobacteria bacterium]|nr:UPF0149 family protein [Gammaproteobacteria bacterium]MBU1416440.1 UPF0149 family protein [Gammaproteobacteria bacterium]